MASTGEAWRLGRRPAFILIVLALTAASSVMLRGPQVADPYLWFADIDTAHAHGVTMVDGLPRVTYSGELEDNPVTVTQWGLERYSKGDTPGAVLAADWLVDHQQRDGTWRYRFDFAEPYIGVDMRGPWVSGMAQGQALSLLERVWELTNEPRYLAAGRAAMRVLDIPVSRGGVLRQWRGHPWFEEYPSDRPSLVLNGFLFALIGLHDFAETTGDPDAQRLWLKGEKSARALISSFSLSGADSAYALSHLTGAGSEPRAVRGGVYAMIHVELAQEMLRLTGHAVYGDVASRWKGALPPQPWWLRIRGG